MVTAAEVTWNGGGFGKLAGTNVDQALDYSDYLFYLSSLLYTAQQSAITAQAATITTLDGRVDDVEAATGSDMAATLAAMGLYPVGLYGVTYNVAVDQRAAFQDLLDDVGTAGGGEVVVPAGKTVWVNMAFYSGSAPTGAAACLRIPNNVDLRIDGTIKMLPNQPHGKWTYNGAYTMINTKDANSARGVRIYGSGVVDGNSVNNSLNDFHFDGVKLSNADRCSVEGITVKNVRGTGGSPPNESFAVFSQRSSNVHFKDIKVMTDDGGSSSSGVSDSWSYGVLYENCVVEDCKSGQGFALHATGDATYSNCRAYQISSNGFNCEVPSGPVRYIGCTAGGKAGPDYKGMTSEIYTAGEDLGCGTQTYHAGFQINCYVDPNWYEGTPGDSPQASVTMVGCSSQYNKNGVGVRIDSGNVMPIVIDDCDLRYNERYGIVNNGQEPPSGQIAATTANTIISEMNRISGNTLGQLGANLSYTSLA